MYAEGDIDTKIFFQDLAQKSQLQLQININLQVGSGPSTPTMHTPYMSINKNND